MDKDDFEMWVVCKTTEIIFGRQRKTSVSLEGRGVVVFLLERLSSGIPAKFLVHVLKCVENVPIFMVDDSYKNTNCHT